MNYAIPIILIVILAVGGFAVLGLGHGTPNGAPRTTVSAPSTTLQTSTVPSGASTTAASTTIAQKVTLENYMMAFLACTSCNNPSNHTTYLAESNDGMNWTPVPYFTPFKGSVPDVVRRNQTLYIYNPGTLTKFNLSSGTQSQTSRVALEYSNGVVAAGFVDPSLMNVNGTLVLFYLPALIGQDPAQCPPGGSSCTKYIMSATEKQGSDGSTFIIDNGSRVGITVTGPGTASDPSIFVGPNGYYLYVSEGQSVAAFFSKTLRGNYAPVSGLQNGTLVQQGTGGVPCGYYDNATKMFWTYVTVSPNGGYISLAKTSSINSSIPSSAFKTVVSGCTFSGLGCSYETQSPGVHSTK